MRRADRLFQIVQLLKNDRYVTARSLAESLEVSERTIYRDIQDLSASGVPITGEAGAGYRLLEGFHLPPVMFTEEEVAALVVGMRMVQAWTDRSLAKAAFHALQKIEAVVPEHLQAEIEREEILVPDFSFNGEVAERLATYRRAIKARKKVAFNYTREDGEQSIRTIHPLGLFYWGKVWTLVAWCELRDEFRHFRLDRMENVQVLDENYTLISGQTLQDYLATVCADS